MTKSATRPSTPIIFYHTSVTPPPDLQDHITPVLTFGSCAGHNYRQHRRLLCWPHHNYRQHRRLLYRPQLPPTSQALVPATTTANIAGSCAGHNYRQHHRLFCCPKLPPAEFLPPATTSTDIRLLRRPQLPPTSWLLRRPQLWPPSSVCSRLHLFRSIIISFVL